MNGAKKAPQKIDHKSWILCYLILFFIELFIVCITQVMLFK